MDKDRLIEVNFDGMVGPTHNYGGLSYGNVASLSFASDVSSPKQGALQGLKKAKALMDRGLVQGLIPPQLRPQTDFLRNIGFVGSDIEVLQNAFKQDPVLLAMASSSSFMWTANASTVAPSADTKDGKVHLTPANLRAKPHRAIEPYLTQRALETIFSDTSEFSVHPALEGGDAFSDEGAANHTRLEVGDKVVHFFVYGREAMNPHGVQPKKFPARQTLEASKAIARVNQLKDGLAVFAQQNPDVIDAGVFHNDVISVGHKNVLLYHEDAFLNTEAVLKELNEKLGGQLVAVLVPKAQVSVAQAVKSYLFNSQLVSLPEGGMALVAPEHCQQDPDVKAFIDSMLEDTSNPVNEALYFDLLQSMKNGGGPACLRLRVQLTEAQIQKVNPGCILTNELYEQLVTWVNKHYRDELTLTDIPTESFLSEVNAAHTELAKIMNLGALYK